MSSKSKNILEELYHSFDSDSEDEDYVCKEEESSDRGESSGSDEDTIENESDDDSSKAEETEEEKVSKKETVKVKQPVVQKSTSNVSAKSQNTKMNAKINARNITICCICLNENSDATDELVECDLCGLYVHEGCYGISDTDSKLSTNSSASTEPWFCNACLLDVKSPSCELCPLKDGIFKETEARRLTHAICALYTPNVAYQDTEKLWPVVLDEIPFIKWGDQMCALCEDVRFARTGVCIKCDAGLCRNYFHVTCAQKHGFLVDPLQQDEMHSGDPYFAYCKQHQDRSQINARKQNYLAMISNFNEKKSQNEALMNSSNASVRERLMRKLQRAKDVYQQNCLKRQRPLSPKSKIPRMLTTCPSAVKSLIRKAELLGARTDYRIDQQQRAGTATFSVDFVNYYFKRENKFPESYDEHNKLRDLQENLKSREQELKKVYEEKLKEHDNLIKSHEELENVLSNYMYIIENYSKTKLNINSKLFLKIDEESNSTHEASNSMSSKQHIVESLNLTELHSCSICNQNTNMHLMIDCDTCKKYYHITCLDPPLTTVPKKTKLYGWECSSCGNGDTSDEEEESVDLNTPRALRACDQKKREEKKKFNIISKYSNRVSSLAGLYKTEKKAAAKNNENEKKPGKKRGRKRANSLPDKPVKKVKKDHLNSTEGAAEAKPRKRVTSTSSISSVISYHSAATSLNNSESQQSKAKLDDSTTLNQTAPAAIPAPKRRGRRKQESIIAKCSACNEVTVSNKTTTIKCGECNNWFHLKCLSEPVRQYKGYIWICKTCEPSEQDDDDDSDDDKDEEDKDEAGEQETVNRSKTKLNESNQSSTSAKRIKTKKRISS